MRNPDRIYPFCMKLAELWMNVPDWRFGQLMTNFVSSLPRDVWFYEEPELIKVLEEYLNKSGYTNFIKNPDEISNEGLWEEDIEFENE